MEFRKKSQIVVLFACVAVSSSLFSVKASAARSGPIKACQPVSGFFDGEGTGGYVYATTEDEAKKGACSYAKAHALTDAQNKAKIKLKCLPGCEPDGEPESQGGGKVTCENTGSGSYGRTLGYSSALDACMAQWPLFTKDDCASELEDKLSDSTVNHYYATALATIKGVKFKLQCKPAPGSAEILDPNRE